MESNLLFFISDLPIHESPANFLELYHPNHPFECPHYIAFGRIQHNECTSRYLVSEVVCSGICLQVRNTFQTINTISGFIRKYLSILKYLKKRLIFIMNKILINFFLSKVLSHRTKTQFRQLFEPFLLSIHILPN